jgi:GH15 family glucan-1,4-alpha-glucosidase
MAYGGLMAAAKISESYSCPWRFNSDTLLRRASKLKEAINNNLWLEGGDNDGNLSSSQGYFVRGIWSDSLKQDVRTDASSIAMVFLNISSSTNRSIAHLNQVRSNLTQDGFGIGRYWNDPFFYDR